MLREGVSEEGALKQRLEELGGPPPYKIWEKNSVKKGVAQSLEDSVDHHRWGLTSNQLRFQQC